MELLIIGGLLAVAALVGFAGYFLLQHRRSGTVKAVSAPRASLGHASAEPEEGADREAGGR